MPFTFAETNSVQAPLNETDMYPASFQGVAHPPLSILIADDETELAELLSHVLHRDGHTVQLAATGTDALRILRQQPVDLLITDMRMPEMNDGELIQLVHQEFPDLQTIAISNREQTIADLSVIRKGHIVYLQKPLSNETLRIAIDSAAENITLRNRLSHTDQKLKQLIAAIPDAIWSTSPSDSSEKLFYSFVSPVIESITGYPPSHYQQEATSHMQAVHPKDAGRLRRTLDFMLEGGLPQTSCSYRLLHADGDFRWVKDAITAEKTESGLVRLSGILSDITNQHKTEKMLRDSEAFQKAIIDSLPDAIFIQDSAGTFQSCHCHDVSTLYRAPDEFIGRTSWEMLPYPIASRFEKMRTRILAGSHCECTEYTLPIMGDIRHFEMRMVAMQTIYTLATVRDITPLYKTRAALEKSEEIHRVMLKHCQDAVFIDDGSTIIFANQRMTNMLGYTEQELSNIPFSDLLHPDDRHNIQDFSYDCDYDVFSSSYMARILHKDHGVIVCEIKLTFTTYQQQCAVLGTLHQV